MAQVPAPDFICTRTEAGDEVLTWTNVPTDTCTFQATVVYRSETAEGPYTALDSITDPNQTEYRDPNPNGGQLWYYLRYATSCADTVAPATSDTLDSFIPVTPEFDFVSVVGDSLVLHWQPSPSPEVDRYVVLEVTDGGIFPVDTVTGTTYTINGVPADERTNREYRITALDACNNDSEQSTVRQAFDVTGSGGTGCTADIELVPLEAVLTSFVPVTPGGSDTVSLFVSVNGGGYTRYADYTAASFPDSTASYVYAAANDGDSLCFYFEIAYSGIELSQRTDVYCQTVSIQQPVRAPLVYGVEQLDDGRLRFAYDDPYPAPATYGQALERPAGPLPPNLLADSLLSFTETTTTAAPGPTDFAARDSLRFSLTDDCGRTAVSNWVSLVLLAAQEQLDGSVDLQWTPLVNGLPGTTTYNLYRIQADSSLTVVATDLDSLAYTDTDPADGSLRCYRVEAVFQPEGSFETYTFLSNLACVLEETRVFLPNAFSPVATREENRVFRPIFNTTAGVTGYVLRIFDRWGGLRFESTDPLVGWDGRQDGRSVETGAYLYTLSFSDENGNPRERSGVVYVLY